MSTGSQEKIKRSLEIVKWLVVTILLISTITGNYLCRNCSLLLKFIVVIIGLLTTIGIALTTIVGKSVIMSVREAYTEINKVVWPTYKETLYTTLIIIIVTIVISLILWGLDSILIYIISFITNLRF